MNCVLQGLISIVFRCAFFLILSLSEIYSLRNMQKYQFSNCLKKETGTEPKRIDYRTGTFKLLEPKQ